MNFIIRLLVTSMLVVILAYFLPGVHVDGFSDAIIVAVVLGLLNTFIKPILVFLTFPFTIVTLGLFLLVINTVIILLADYLVPGFNVSGFFVALLFSIILSISQGLLSFLTNKE